MRALNWLKTARRRLFSDRPGQQELAGMSGSPFRSSPYFDMAEEHMDRQWDYYIWPVIKGLDFAKVVEIAAGHGRNSARLVKLAGRLYVTDINETCIEACRQRLAGQQNVDFVLVNGKDLRPIPARAATLVYSFDSMVHFEPEIFASYVKDLKRVLDQGGHAFLHHSNYTAGSGRAFQENPHWRNHMSAERAAEIAQHAGLEVVSQRIIGWDESVPDAAEIVPRLDCLSLFRRPG